MQYKNVIEMTSKIQNTELPSHKFRWHILIILSICLLLVSMDATILHTVMPTIILDLEPSNLQQLWIINAYALVLSGLLITTGALGDRFGRKKLLLWGLVVFAIASMLVYVFHNPWGLVLCRALLGLGGAMIMPSTLSILRNIFIDAHERMIAISVWGIMASVGAAIGPVLGGILVEFLSWQSAFFVNAPIAFAIIAFGIIQIPESSTPSNEPWDWLGVFESFFGMAALVQGIKVSSKYGIMNLASGGMLLIGIILMTLFTLRQLKSKDPLVDIRLFLINNFSVGIIVYLLTTCALGSIMYLMSLWLQFIKGLSPLYAGLYISPVTVSALITAFIMPYLLVRFTARIVIFSGLIFITISLILPSILNNEDLLSNAIYFALLGIGVSLCLSTTVSVIMATAPAERAGGAAALQETAYELGNVLGIAVIGSITSFIYSTSIIIPKGVSREMATIARDSIGEGIIVAHQLPFSLAEELIREANIAFINAFDIVGIILGIIMLIAACLTMYFLPPFKVSTPSH
ncbi:Antiseptic resistance protein [Rickettsiales bacterium Ac37b]|nr:Antiseptic resistance protein [Rickettsiales bacterium Ac37b]